MKHVLLTTFLAICSLTISYADCTVTTECRTDTFEGNISATNDNGVVTISRDGAVIESYFCDDDSNQVSVNCSSDGAPAVEAPAFDICDFVPASLKSFFGCN